MRKAFDRQLAQLGTSMIQMGACCGQAIGFAVRALTDKDPAMARKAVETDREIDRLERETESLCLKLLLQQQPVAGDMRFISAALKMITDMERIGDQAAEIADIVLLLTARENMPCPEHIYPMAGAAMEMVGCSVEAWGKTDVNLARQVIAMDDTVDDLFSAVKQELSACIAASPGYGEQALDILMIAKYLERIGDHAVNIAQWVEFSLLGRRPESER